MSRSEETSFGKDLTFVLANPSRSQLVTGATFVAIGVIAVYWVWGAPTIFVLIAALPGAAFASFGAWTVNKALRLRGVAGSAVVTTRELRLTPPGLPTTTVPLEAIAHVRHVMQNGQRDSVVFEQDDGTKVELLSLNITPGSELELAAVVRSRGAIRRGGARGRDEIAAAEAYLASRRLGVTPFAVLVVKDGKQVRDVLCAPHLEQLPAVRARASEDAPGLPTQLFVSEATLLALRGDPAFASARPLRGIEPEA